MPATALLCLAALGSPGAVLVEATPEPATVDLRPFERLFPAWCAQFRSGPGTGDFSYFPGHPTSVYGSADTLMSLSVLGLLNLTEAEKDSWAVRRAPPLLALAASFARSIYTRTNQLGPYCLTDS